MPDHDKATQQPAGVRAAAEALLYAYRSKYRKPSTDGLRGDAPLRDEMGALAVALAAPPPPGQPVRAPALGAIKRLIDSLEQTTDNTWRIRGEDPETVACAAAEALAILSAGGGSEDKSAHGSAARLGSTNMRDTGAGEGSKSGGE